MGLFFLTAGHCQAQGTVVWGLTDPFGVMLRNDDGRGMDAALVQPYSGVDAWQDVVNDTEGVVGHTVGKLSNSQLTGGMFVNKIGRTTGWTRGQIDPRWFAWANGERIKCGIYESAGGDSGGPVFTRDSSNRAWAVGMHVGRAQVAPGVWWPCFITIDDLLARFGAWLPVFSAAGGKAISARPTMRPARGPIWSKHSGTSWSNRDLCQASVQPRPGRGM